MIEQKYYKVDLTINPQITRYCAMKTDNYSYHYKYDKLLPHLGEICYLETGSVTELKDGVETTYTAGHAKAFIHNEIREVYSHDPVHNEYFIMIRFAEEPVLMTEEELAAWTPKVREAIMPGLVQDPKINQQLAPLIKKAVQEVSIGDACRYLQFYSVLYEIFALLTEYSLSRVKPLQQKKTKKMRHCTRACNFIEKQLSERITVKEVAVHVGITYHYLCQIFTEVMGMPLVEYINRQKLQYVQQLLTECDLTLEQAAASIGFDDPKYFSRLFRKYTGITFSEYKKQFG